MKTNACLTEIKILKTAFLISLIITMALASVNADAKGSGDWQQIHTENTIIYFQNLDDLHQFNTRINYGLNNQKAVRTLEQKADSSLAEIIAEKIDALFRRSQEILEMQGFTNKINVKIFKNRQQLSHAFYKLYKKECNARAWYTHERLTIFVQLDDIHEGILAHEFAHAIIDHYMIIPPPGKPAEILARYVDTHLHENNTRGSSDSHIKGYSVK